MKVKKLKIENFAKFESFEIEYNDSVTHLVGFNGAGKTTVGITAIWACLKGIAEKSKDGALVGDRFRFIGPKKATADLELTLVDEVKNAEIEVKNTISKDGNHISFKAPKGYPINQSWLNSLLSVAFLSAKQFTQLTSKDQALLLGIDVSAFDAELKALKEEYTAINRELRGIGELKPVPKVEKVSIAKLLLEKQEIDKHNAEQKKRAEDIAKAKSLLGTLREQEIELRKKLAELQKRIEEGNSYMASLPDPEEEIDATPVIQAIQRAEETNRNAEAYARYVEAKKRREEKEAELKENKEKQAALEREKVDFIRGFDFGVDGLSVDEDGGLLLNGRPVREPYYSKGELEVIVAKLYASKNPELKVRFVDDFDLLDETNQAALVKELVDAGFQVITASVGSKSADDNTIVLRECKIAAKEAA